MIAKLSPALNEVNAGVHSDPAERRRGVR